jgi:Ala-tRNA(Pro) deacylase
MSSIPTSPDQLFAHLEGLGIQTRTTRHPPVFTVEEARALRGDPGSGPGQVLPGAHIKNLFLRNKKGEMWLVVAEEERAVDLKSLGEKLGAGRLSFGSPERLMTYLGVLPGAVTPFALVNDRHGQVRVAVDKAVLAQNPVNCHPLTNDMTTAIAPDDLLAFMAASGHKPTLLDFDNGAA